MDKPVVRDGMLLVFRVVLGLVFVAHGWDKLFFTGITETTGQFSAAGVPQPKLSAWIAALAELVGGGMLVVGLLATFAAVGLALLMACAFYFVHLGSTVFVAEGGFEYVVVLVVALLMIVVFGPGRASIDGVLGR
ncbi:DoxX family protein [Corynebacterium pygosceleis]|uniref:DoxX family protein n=1 Tax=Corynebacterium pygosceleis TaxID=2800406 RepID=A0A9Q4GM00_9CORY|nr:DoxX family protein [Corynebacterium pygosceleis]MCK7638114.1 DoxX family protein [Corynebacterium pygosceleis]MCK7675828.1 DoxX family protein [Corynebacterium pygosceleis]MCL0120790.1 DoxX family protein [Corynebacterium pygosceleis]MCX7444331.1 DoxX family protein [Corynebacterium pygosceleis]MCX7468830.1 DoxX family protein [Corynebacterium pygosceleis]